MKKIKDFVLSINFTLLVFFTVGMRITVMGASIGDALVILSLCGLQAFNKWLENNQKQDINETIAKELNDMKAHLSGLVIKNSVRPPSNASDTGMKKFF